MNIFECPKQGLLRGDLNHLYEQRRQALQGPWEASFVRYVPWICKWQAMAATDFDISRYFTVTSPHGPLTVAFEALLR